MRRGILLAIALFTFSVGARVRAEEPGPSPERIKAAAEEFDRGRRAYLSKAFEEAAVHFESAFRDAPRAETLRLAMRARRDAGQLARAATLASIGQERYPDDVQTGQLAAEILAAGAPALQQCDVVCARECAIAVDGRVVSQADALRHRIWLDPGPHELGASFRGGRSVTRDVEATKGGKEELTFEPPAEPEPEPAPRPSAPRAPVERPPPPMSPTATLAPPPAAPRSPDKPLRPLVFFVGAGLTAAAGGATIWSGLDTVASPGADRVRAECAGKDASCPAYQEGQDKEVRTNVLLGTTIGLGLVTGVVGLLFTRWSSPERRTALRVVPGGLAGAF